MQPSLQSVPPGKGVKQVPGDAIHALWVRDSA